MVKNFFWNMANTLILIPILKVEKAIKYLLFSADLETKFNISSSS